MKHRQAGEHPNPIGSVQRCREILRYPEYILGQARQSLLDGLLQPALRAQNILVRQSAVRWRAGVWYWVSKGPFLLDMTAIGIVWEPMTHEDCCVWFAEGPTDA